MGELATRSILCCHVLFLRVCAEERSIRSSKTKCGGLGVRKGLGLVYNEFSWSSCCVSGQFVIFVFQNSATEPVVWPLDP